MAGIGSELGFGAGGVADALQLMQNLQGGEIQQQRDQVALQTEQVHLANLQKLQHALTVRATQQAQMNPDGTQAPSQNQQLMDLANIYIDSNFPQQAKAVSDMALNDVYTRAYAAEQQAAASKKYIDMAEDLFSGVTNAQQWSAAQQFMQSQLPPEALQNPTVKGLLTSGYSPDKVRILPQFFDRLKSQAQAMADRSRAEAEDARARHYKFEDKRDDALANASNARADYYRSHGAGDLVPSKAEIDSAADDLQSQFPEEEAEPVVQGGKITDNTAIHANYKARVKAAAVQVAETAKAYQKGGMKPSDARKKAIDEAKSRGDLSSLQRQGPGPKKDRSATAATPNSAEGWGEPTQVK